MSNNTNQDSNQTDNSNDITSRLLTPPPQDADTQKGAFDKIIEDKGVRVKDDIVITGNISDKGGGELGVRKELK